MDKVHQLLVAHQSEIIGWAGKLEQNRYFSSIKKTLMHFTTPLLLVSLLLMMKSLPISASWQGLLTELVDLVLPKMTLIFAGILGYHHYQNKSQQEILSWTVYMLLVTIMGMASPSAGVVLAILILPITDLTLFIYDSLDRKLENIGNSTLNMLPKLFQLFYFMTILLVIFAATRWILRQLLMMQVLSYFHIDYFWMVGIFVILEMCLWYIGINGYGVMVPVILPFAYNHLLVNFHHLNLGKGVPYTFTPNFWDYFLSVSGAGMVAALVILCLLSSKPGLKDLGKSSLRSALFSVSEPIIFGMPLTMNRIFLFPFIFGTSIVGVFQWWVFEMGWVNKPMYFVADLPLPFSVFFSTMDWRSIVLAAVSIGLMVLIYYPFFKKYEAAYQEKVVSEDKYADLDLDF